MSIEHKWRLMFRYVPRFSIPNVNIRDKGRVPVTVENRGLRDRAAWVPTGGRSSRMGTDKALLDIAGPPLASRVAKAAAGFCDSVALFHLNAVCSLPRYEDGRVEPLCAVYHRRCQAPIRAALESGIRKVTDALRSLETDGFAERYLPVSNAEPFANLNTPDEVQKYLNG